MAFENVKKNFGFGCMRLKLTDDKVDYREFSLMIDAFMASGFNYFDTAHGYIGGQSETAIRDCLSARYKREDFVLTNKLSVWCFERAEDIVPLFESQLAACGVDYFDFYLLHALGTAVYQKHKTFNSFEIVQKLKAQGKIKHIGISFHDTADVLDTILTEQPCIEVVQLQFNYLDYDHPDVQSKACYDVAVKHGKKVLVMEPVKGGTLVNLPDRAAKLLDSLNDGSHASFALRFAASFPEVFMVLSGMGSMEMMQDNIATFANFVPFSDEEFKVAEQVRNVIRETRQIPCTACNYCAEVCPQNIPISEIFSVYNKYLSAKMPRGAVKKSLSQDKPLPNHCLQCDKCAEVCPQNISIKEHLEQIAKIP